MLLNDNFLIHFDLNMSWKYTHVIFLGKYLNWHVMEITFNQVRFIIPSYIILSVHIFPLKQDCKGFQRRGKAEETFDLVFHARDVSESYINQFLKGVICCAIYRAGQKVITAWPAAETHLNAGWANEPAILSSISQSSESIPRDQRAFVFLCAACFCLRLWATDADSVWGGCEKTNHVDWKYI